MIIEDIDELRKWILSNEIRYFRAEEFICKHCGRVKMDTDLVKKLEKIRRLYNRPIIITSAYRCPIHNFYIGGVPDSAHVRGYAADISVPDSFHRGLILPIIYSVGIGRVGIYQRFIHIDIDPEKPSPRTWIGKKRRSQNVRVGITTF